MVKPGTRKNRLEREPEIRNTFSSGSWPSEDTIVAGSIANRVTVRDVFAKARAKQIRERQPIQQRFQRQRFPQRSFQNRPQPPVRPRSTSQVVPEVHALPVDEFAQRVQNPFCADCDYRNKAFRNPRPDNIGRWCLIATMAEQEGKVIQCPFKSGNASFGRVIVLKPEKISQPQPLKKD